MMSYPFDMIPDADMPIVEIGQKPARSEHEYLVDTNYDRDVAYLYYDRGPSIHDGHVNERLEACKRLIKPTL